MSEMYRIRRGSYTDSDVLAFYMKYREAKVGPFIREVGDFIAHRKRDRGVTLETTAYSFSELAFFQTYQSGRGTPINPFGPCGWWLKTYYLGKLKEATVGEIRRATNLDKRQAREEIESWFPGKDPYPTTIECRNLSVFFGLTEIFSRFIRGRDVFAAEAVENELKEVFYREKIPFTEVPHFKVATAVILARRSCEIVPNFLANIRISIERRQVVLVDMPVPEGATWKYVNILPDGNLKVTISTEDNTGDGLVGISLNLLDMQVDSEIYFDRRLIKVDEYKLPTLDLARPLGFERQSVPMVFATD